jgi:dTDP-4-dehydrorhamnose reductase
MNTLLAIGLGYSAKEIAARLTSSPLPVGEVGAPRRVRGLEAGSNDGGPSPQPSPDGRGSNNWRIIGTSRNAEGVAAIEALGHDAVLFNGNAPSPALTQAIAEATHLLHSAPPSADGDPLLIHHEADLTAAPHLKWIGYLSTIGVYGDTGGAWVDETTPPNPGSERSRQRWAAEQAWMEFAVRRDVTLQIFRLAGIYGPGRNALERLREGREKRIDKPDQVFNRIHRDDIAATVLAGIRAGRTATGVFNVTDDEPAPPQDVVTYAAELLGVEPPPLIPWGEAQKDMTPMARSFYSETKRVLNSRIKDTLGVKLAYPTYREGLGDLARGLAG